MIEIFEPRPTPEPSEALVHARAAWVALAEETDTLPHEVTKAANEGRSKDFAELTMRQISLPSRLVEAERELVLLEAEHAMATESHWREERKRASLFKEAKLLQVREAQKALRLADGAWEEMRSHIDTAMAEIRRWQNRARAVGLVSNESEAA
jgi:FMN phosphatase YigB (HAD superfamily)